MKRFLLLGLCLLVFVFISCGDDDDGGNGAPGSLDCNGQSMSLGEKCKAMYEKITACCADKTVGNQQAKDVICGMQANETACGAAGAAADAACSQLGVRPECKESGGDSDTTGGADTSGGGTDTGGTTMSNSEYCSGYCDLCVKCTMTSNTKCWTISSVAWTAETVDKCLGYCNGGEVWKVFQEQLGSDFDNITCTEFEDYKPQW